MTVRDDLSLLTPRLRRYARGLVQSSPRSSESADELVRSALLRLIEDTPSDRKCDVTLAAFALVTQLHRDQFLAHRFPLVETRRNAVMPNRWSPAQETNCIKGKGLFEGLAFMKIDEREALLLVVVEQFSYLQAMHILHVSRASLIARLARARARLQEALAPPVINAYNRRATGEKYLITPNPIQ